MVNNDEQQFLNNLDKKLWTSADKLRSTLDASQYKHTVLGLIFLKYVSDSFDIRRTELTGQFKNSDHEYYLAPADFGGEDSAGFQAELNAELEQRDYYAETNVFWVPKVARWEFLQNQNKVVINSVIWLTKAGDVLTQAPEDETEKRLCTRISSVGQLIDHALEAIEQDNVKLKGILNKRYTSLQIDPAKLGELIDLIATIPFKHASLSSKDILGHVYEYFLGQFALAEGKKGGQFYTPKSIVSLIVQMLEPFKGRIGDVSIYGQEYNHTTWQLAAMNMVIRGIDFNFGKEPANTYTNDQHPDLRADFVMANPPFNMREWDTGVSDDDPRWVYGKPPSGNANFAWLQHMLYHLAPNGSMGLLLANGSMSSNTNNEGEIRKALIEKDLVECMVALPGQLFTNTQIPACIWFLTKNKAERTTLAGRKLRNRKGEILFIDARGFGEVGLGLQRIFSSDEDMKIISTYHSWISGDKYQDLVGFCKLASIEDVAKNEYVLTPGRYVGVNYVETENDIRYGQRVNELTQTLYKQFAKAKELEAIIINNLSELGFNAD